MNYYIFFQLHFIIGTTDFYEIYMAEIKETAGPFVLKGIKDYSSNNKEEIGRWMKFVRAF